MQSLRLRPARLAGSVSRMRNGHAEKDKPSLNCREIRLRNAIVARRREARKVIRFDSLRGLCALRDNRILNLINLIFSPIGIPTANTVPFPASQSDNFAALHLGADMDPLQRIACEWCGAQSPTGATACAACGAQLNIKNLVSDSGWREAPRLRDMSEVRFGTSTCQVEGEIVPVAEITLGGGDAVFFEHHVMLWKDHSIALGVLPLQGAMKRLFSGMPFVVSTATGQGVSDIPGQGPNRQAPSSMRKLAPWPAHRMRSFRRVR